MIKQEHRAFLRHFRTAWKQADEIADQKRIEILTDMRNSGFSRSQAALVLGSSTRSISLMVEKYNMDWPKPINTRLGRRYIQTDTYRQFAAEGYTKKEAALAIGVSYNTLSEIAKRHGIVFRDGRSKQT